MKHQNLTTLFGETWIWPLQKAFDTLKEEIIPFLKAEIDNRATLGLEVYPPTCHLFRAFKEVPYDDVRVVILGQDPYHDAGSAIGVSFDNPKSKKPSPSLRNILKEIAEDTGAPSKASENLLSYLEHLPPQGVLLLNTALSVVQGQPGAHAAVWKSFTKEVISALNKKPRIIWLMWGNHAQKFIPQITNKKHIIIKTSHPSPFSYKKFKGCNCFTQVNSHLAKTINW